MKTMAKLLALAVMLGVFSAPVVRASASSDDEQPHMKAALEALKQARKHLEEAAPDKAGHRVAAIKACDEAIKHTEMGIKAGEKHEEHHEHEHDKK